MAEKVAYAKESSRFYDRDARVVAEVPCKSKDGMKAPTIKDAIELRLRPSVTEIGKSISKVGLDIWKMNHLLDVVIKNPFDGQDEVAWKLKVHEISKEFAGQAADRGKEIHKGVDRYFMLGEENPDVAIERTYSEIEAHYRAQYPECTLVAEESFSSDLGYAGTIDLQVFDKDGILVVMSDLKTKELAKFKKPNMSDGLQLGAYSAAKGEESFIDTMASDRDSGEVKFFRWGTKIKRTQMKSPEELRRSFLMLFEFWCIWNYDPRLLD